MAYLRSFSTLEPFFLALRQAIVDTGIFSANCVDLDMWEQFPQYPQGTPLLQIIPGDFRSWDGSQDGGGIETTVLVGNIDFSIFIENILDSVNTDQNVMTVQSSTLGSYRLVDQLIGEVQMLDLCDANHNSYLIEPMRLVSVSKGNRNTEHPEWTLIKVTFNIRLNQQITGI